MKKLLLIGVLAFTLFACSKEDTPQQQEQSIVGTLNIPEIFRGEFVGVQTGKHAKIYATYLVVETDRGVKTIISGTNEYYNGFNHYSVDLPNGEQLILLQGNGFVGITIYASPSEGGGWVISDYFE